MKCTDFYSLYQALDKIAKDELIKAIKAHNGVCEFASEEDVEEREILENSCPVVIGNLEYGNEPSHYYVMKVEVKTNRNGIDILHIYGTSMDYPGYYDEMEDIEHGYLPNIIDFIPETDEVSDVASENLRDVFASKLSDYPNVKF